MKIIKPDKPKASNDKRNITIQIKGGLVDKIDELGGEHDISRQKLIELILEQALGDKNFILKLPE